MLPSEITHELIANAGIDSNDDARSLVDALGPGGVATDALDTIATAIRSGELLEAFRVRWQRDGESRWRREVARGVARAHSLAGTSSVTRPELAEFSQLLTEYSAEGPEGTLLGNLEELISDALTVSFGESAAGETYFRMGNAKAQNVRVLVRVPLQPGRTHTVKPDPITEKNPRGSAVVGYRPLSIALEIAGVTVSIDYPLYSVLKASTEGDLPSSSALERYFSLRRAAAALGERAAGNTANPLLLADLRKQRRIRLEASERGGVLRFREREVV
jgi:hypothetical protein